jgi:DNA replication protein DnaC
MTYEYNFNQDCWYLKNCAYTDTDKCGLHCNRYLEMHYLMNNSNLPNAKQYRIDLIPEYKDRPAFNQLLDIKVRIKSWVEFGNNLYICSQHFGNGKTSWAIKLLQNYFNSVWAGNGFRCRGLFIHVPTFLSKFKSTINNRDKDFELLLQRLTEVDLVIWDDIASVKLSNYDHANILSYLDQRLLSEKSNIFTGNATTVAEIEEALGNRLSSRIINSSLKIEFVGNDRRHNKW